MVAEVWRVKNKSWKPRITWTTTSRVQMMTSHAIPKAEDKSSYLVYVFVIYAFIIPHIDRFPSRFPGFFVIESRPCDDFHNLFQDSDGTVKKYMIKLRKIFVNSTDPFQWIHYGLIFWSKRICTATRATQGSPKEGRRSKSRRDIKLRWQFKTHLSAISDIGTMEYTGMYIVVSSFRLCSLFDCNSEYRTKLAIKSDLWIWCPFTAFRDTVIPSRPKRSRLIHD